MRSYRILRICAANPYIDLFTDFYQTNKLDELSYEDTLQKYRENGYLIPGGWSLCMRQLGNESTDAVPDFMPLQRHWAKENGVKIDFNKSDWNVSALFAQIAAIKPDVIFFYAGGFHTLSADIRKQLKETFPFLKIVTGHWGDILTSGDYSIFQDLDLMFCTDTHFRDSIMSAGIKAHLTPNCFDHLLGERVEQDNSIQQVYDFIFAGTSGYRFEVFLKRYLGLIKLMENTNLRAWCWERIPPPTRLSINSIKWKLRDIAVRMLCIMNIENLQRLKRRFTTEGAVTILSCLVDDAIKIHQGLYKYDWWHDHKPLRELFPSKCLPPVFGLEYYRLLKSAKIVFNRHTDTKGQDCSGNIRMFEVTGVGSCLLTDRGNETAHLFVPDEEIVTYSSIDECIEKVNYLLDNESVRIEIAKKGKARTLKDHTVMNRCTEVNDVLQKML